MWRKAWADISNAYLERAGSPERIDHRSNAERGIDEIPTVHMGVAACQMEKKGIATEKGELNRNMRKMALNGYVLHVDLSDIRELVALQRRCANNLNQVAVHANTYGIYPSEIAALQKDYADLWEPLSELLKKLSAVVSM